MKPALFALALLALPAAAAATDCDEGRFLSRVRQLSFDGARAGEGYWSPDGQRLVFQSERVDGNPFYQIFVLDLATGDTQMVSTGTGKTTCAFFGPQGDTVLFASTHDDPSSERLQQEELDFRASGKERRYSWDYDPSYELYLRDLDSRRLTRLTHAKGYDAEGSISPDGRWIAFTSNRHAFAPGAEVDPAVLERDPAYYNEIYLMPNEAGAEATRLTHTPGYDGGPFFTTDGTRILWRRFDEDGLNADIFTMALDDSDVVQVTDFHSMSWAPYMHPSGEYILFGSNKFGFDNFELFLVDTAGTKQPVRVSCTPGFDGLPVPSPGGDRLAWTSNRGDGDAGQLWLARWDHEAALQALEQAPDRGTTKMEAP